LIVSIEYESPWPAESIVVGATVRDQHGRPVFGTNTQMASDFTPLTAAAGVATLRIDNLPLHTGLYRLSAWLGDTHNHYDFAEDALLFNFVSRTRLPGGVTTDLVGNLNVSGDWQWSGRSFGRRVSNG